MIETSGYRLAAVLGLGAALAAAAVTYAQAAGGMVEVIHARQAHYKQIGGAMKGIVDTLKSPHPNVALIQRNAKVIDTLAPQVPTWFPRGSGPEAGVKTTAKPLIWSKPDVFKRDAAALATQAHAFDMAAASGDLSRIHAALPALGETCKTCHQEFRTRDD